MSKFKIFFIIILNLLISGAFYIENEDATFEEISSDLANIIPICKKFDDTTLYKKDLYLSDVKNVEYYTPFFVQPLRFIAKHTNYDYLKALNILSFITHLTYGILWFLLLFFLGKDFWLAVIFSIFMRGVIWPPGSELLGISYLWTIMPRTLYTALMPLPFLLYSYLKKYKLIVSAVTLGFIFNFHAISGIGGLVIYFAIFAASLYWEEQKITWFNVKKLGIAILFCFLGMLPFLMTYFTKVNNTLFLDQELFQSAFQARISEIFSNPIAFIFSWHRPATYVFGMCFILYYFFDTSKHKKVFKTLLFAIILLFITANSSVYIEQLINYLWNKNIRMSFQLIRFQKYILIVFQISAFLLFLELCKYFKIKDKAKAMLFFICVFVLIFAKATIFNAIPIINEDFTRLILPNNLQYVDNPVKEDSLSKMIEYIKENTSKDAVFYGFGACYIRAGSDRSVVLDSKGAGMLIEGNQKLFVEWYKEKKYIENFNQKDLIKYLKENQVDYFVVKEKQLDLNLEKQIGNIFLYKLE